MLHLGDPWNMTWNATGTMKREEMLNAVTNYGTGGESSLVLCLVFIRYRSCSTIKKSH